jgi:hypothetical protein
VIDVLSTRVVPAALLLAIALLVLRQPGREAVPEVAPPNQCRVQWLSNEDAGDDGWAVSWRVPTPCEGTPEALMIERWREARPALRHCLDDVPSRTLGATWSDRERTFDVSADDTAGRACVTAAMSALDHLHVGVLGESSTLSIENRFRPLHLRWLDVDGGLDPGIVDRYFGRNLAAISACYTNEGVDDARAELTVDVTGKVGSATVTGGSASAARCATRVIRAIEFPRHAFKSFVTVSFRPLSPEAR